MSKTARRYTRYANDEDRLDAKRRSARGWYWNNLEKARKAARERHHKNPGRRTEKLCRTYGLDSRGIPDICGCCGGPPTGRGRLHLDHDHRTGEFRGWICAQCNVGLGLLGDNMHTIKRALAYLEGSVAVRRKFSEDDVVCFLSFLRVWIPEHGFTADKLIWAWNEFKGQHVADQDPKIQETTKLLAQQLIERGKDHG